MILGTIAGIVGGITKDLISKVSDYKQDAKDKQHELELEKIRSNNRVKEAQAGITIAQEQTKQSQFQLQTEEQKTYGIKAQSEASALISEHDAYKSWYENITKATGFLVSTASNKVSEICNGIVNVFIATTRPLITYLLLLLVWKVYATASEQHGLIISTILDAFAASVSFWFYDRGINSVRNKSLKKSR